MNMKKIFYALITALLFISQGLIGTETESRLTIYGIAADGRPDDSSTMQGYNLKLLSNKMPYKDLTAMLVTSSSSVAALKSNENNDSFIVKNGICYKVNFDNSGTWLGFTRNDIPEMNAGKMADRIKTDDSLAGSNQKAFMDGLWITAQGMQVPGIGKFANYNGSWLTNVVKTANGPDIFHNYVGDQKAKGILYTPIFGTECSTEEFTSRLLIKVTNPTGNDLSKSQIVKSDSIVRYDVDNSKIIVTNSKTTLDNGSTTAYFTGVIRSDKPFSSENMVKFIGTYTETDINGFTDTWYLAVSEVDPVTSTIYNDTTR